MYEKRKIPFVNQVDISATESLKESALDKLSNGFLEIDAGGTATARVRPHHRYERVFSGLSPLNDQSQEQDLDDELVLKTIIPWPVITNSSPVDNYFAGKADYLLLFYSNGYFWQNVFLTTGVTATETNVVNEISGSPPYVGKDDVQVDATFFYDATDENVAIYCMGYNLYVTHISGSTVTTGKWYDEATTDNAGLTDDHKYLSVQHFKNYVFFTDGKTLRWSELNNYKDVPAINVAPASLVVDDIVRLEEYNGELCVFGERSIEFWQLTGESGAAAIAPIVAATISMGCSIGSNVAKFNDRLYFVNNRLEVIEIYNRQPRVLSKQIANILSATIFEDTTGQPENRVKWLEFNFNVSAATISGKNFLFVNKNIGNPYHDETGNEEFNKTYVMNIDNETWSEWDFTTPKNEWYYGFGNPITNPNNGVTYGTHPRTCTRPAQLVSSSEDDEQLDLPVQGFWPAYKDNINFELQTAFIDHGTFSRKNINRLMVRTQKESGDTVVISYKNNKGDNFKDATLDVSTEDNIIELKSMGQYRSRKYKMSATVFNGDFGIAGAEEEVEVQDS